MCRESLLCCLCLPKIMNWCEMKNWKKDRSSFSQKMFSSVSHWISHNFFHMLISKTETSIFAQVGLIYHGTSHQYTFGQSDTKTDLMASVTGAKRFSLWKRSVWTTNGIYTPFTENRNVRLHFLTFTYHSILGKYYTPDGTAFQNVCCHFVCF